MEMKEATIEEDKRENRLQNRKEMKNAIPKEKERKLHENITERR